MRTFKTLLGILLIISFSFEAFAQLGLFENFEKKLVYYYYYGASSNGSSILIWGNTGEVIRSTDEGKNWERVVVSNSLNYFIVGIENIGTKYIGLLNQNYGIVSTNDGKSWQLIDIGEEQRIFKMFRYKNSIFYMTENRFKVLDENFKLIKEFNYSKDTNYNEFVVANNTIVFPSANGKIKLINIENSQEETLDLKSANLCSECMLPTNFFADDNSFYFLLEGFFYRYSFQSKSFSSFTKPLTSRKTAFTFFNGNLYQIYSHYFSGLDSLFFYQLSPTRKRVNTGGFDRRLINSEFTNLKYINNNLVIAVGKNKLACISSNGGQTWRVVSFVNFRNEPRNLFIFDTLNLRIVDEYHNFYYTTNGGITWLPTKTYPSKVLSEFHSYEEQFHYFFDTLNAISVRSKTLTPDSNIIYTTDKGETLKLEYNSKFNNVYDDYHTLPEGEKLLVFTNNLVTSYGIFFVVWEVDKNFNFNYKSHSLFRQISYPVVSNNQIIAPSVSQPPGKTFGDPSYWIIKSSDWGSTWDSLRIPGINNGYKPLDNYISVGTWSFDNNIYMTLSYSNYDTSNFHSLLILYHFDPTTNELTLLDSIGDSFAPYSMFKLYNKYYIFMHDVTYPKTNFKLRVFDSPKSFRDIDVTNERFLPLNFVRSNVDSTLFVVGFWDTLRFGLPYLYLMKDRSYSAVEDSRIDVRYYTTHFYATQPYPLPASNFVKSKLYWDGSFDLHQAIEGVYDAMGNKIEGKARITITELGKATAEMVWDCTGVASGIYFIVVRHNGRADTIPVIVE